MAKWKHNLYRSIVAKAMVDIRRSLFHSGGGWMWLLGAIVIAAPLHADEASTSAVQTSTMSVAPPVVSSATSVTASTVTVPPSMPAPTPAALPGVMPKAPKSFMNEMTGTVLSVDTDAGVVRITVEGGFNVDFKYDNATLISENSKPIPPESLNYGDKVIIRYAGKDLNAREIERTSQAVNPLSNP